MNERGIWMTTYTGVLFYIGDPRPEEVCAEDIARALSKECRFGSHCREFYSVAQHSVIVSDMVMWHAGRPSSGATEWDGTGRNWIMEGLFGLLHDAAEAYVKDLPRPLKKLLPEYKPLENRVQRAILEHFGLWWDHQMIAPYPAVKRADRRLLLTEMRDLTVTPQERIGEVDELKPYPEIVTGMGHEESYWLFKMHLNKLLKWTAQWRRPTPAREATA